MSFSALPAQPETGEKFLGTAVGSEIPEDLLEYWNQVTPENQGKWGVVEKERGEMRWEPVERQYAFARENGLPFKWHTFVWGMQAPKWIKDLPQAEKRAEVEEWIELVTTRFPDIDMIDVVNEPITIPAEQYLDALGGAGETGWDWVIRVFEIAREKAPNATLILNEHTILKSAQKRDRYIEIIKLLQERDLIDAVGLQAHFLEGTDPEEIRENLEKVADLGLPIYISEFDLNIEDDEEQKKTMAAIFPIFWEHPAVKGVTFWGYQEGKMWRKQGYLVRKDGSKRPALEWLEAYLAGETAGESPSSQVLR